MLYEFSIKSSELHKLSAKQIIRYSAKNTSAAIASDNERLFVIPEDHASFFSETSTQMTLEGVSLPENIFIGSFATQLAETVATPLLAVIYSGIRKRLTGSAENIAKITDAMTVGGVSWLLSGSIKIGADAGSIAFGSNAEQNAFERISSRLAAIIGHMHPEDHIVFFRNLLFARKLQFFGETLLRDLNRKPNIAYNFGLGHSGVEDFLRLEKQFTLSLLRIYPKDFLKKIVDWNGGIDTFCTSVLVTPDLINPKKTTIFDKDLKKMFQTKFAI